MLHTIRTVNVSHLDASPLIKSNQVHHDLAENSVKT